MALLLTENEVVELFPMQLAIERVQASFGAQNHRVAVNRARERIFLPDLSLHYMAAALPEEKVLGMKIYTVAGNNIRFVVLLFDAGSGDLLAIIEADQLGRIRTGAASGVATRFMARGDATRVGMVGTGRQARTQLEAVAHVRELTGVRVFGRDPKRLSECCREMSEKLLLAVEPAESAEAAVRFGDIVITATSASSPVVQGDWIQPGAHLNIIGANMPVRREVDTRTLERAGTIAVDSLEQAKKEAGDLIHGLAERAGGWEGILELHEIVAGARPGRSGAGEITIFKSCGIALWDVAAAAVIYREARRLGKGGEIALWQGQ
ncbi:MAG TPA: ornithine cyclodeaminase family protein [Terriglobia bacterium]|nr:ornithine cyclodeaminase family protein [Terriglobia bacterium]